MPEINAQLDLNEEEVYALEMHAFINMITLMYNHMFIMQETSSEPELYDEAMDQVYQLAYGVKSRDRTLFNPGKIREFKKTIHTLFASMKSKGIHRKIADFDEIDSFFSDAIDLVEGRMGDLLVRWANPNKWEVHWVDEFKSTFLNYFYALEKDIHGFYRIAHSIDENPTMDFKIRFEIVSAIGHSITIPVLFKDIMREIITNARKFSHPGGKIGIKLEFDRKNLTLTVRDQGVGIPADEIQHVVEFKYRASNVIDDTSIIGSGFGLTKVYYNINQLGGKLFIDSDVLKGTTVRVVIPVPDHEFMSANFGALDA